MSHHQDVIMSIRIDECLARMLRNMPNRSAFIRESILQALGRCCPACRGSGVAAAPRPQESEETRPTEKMAQPQAVGCIGLN